MGLVLAVLNKKPGVPGESMVVDVLWHDGAVEWIYADMLVKSPQDGAADGHHPLKKSGQK